MLIGAINLLGCQAISTKPADSASRDAKLFEHHVERDHVVLHSDFEVPGSDPLLAELNSLRLAIAQQLSLTPADATVHIYLFSKADGYYDFLSRRFPGFPPRRALFVETPAELAVYAHWGEQVVVDLRHEVTHGYLHATIPNLPLWLDEGLAEYFEVGAANAGLNQEHVEHLQSLTNWQPDLARLEKLQLAADMTQLDYAES